MAATSFETAAGRNSNLIRKALQGAVLLGDFLTLPAVTTLAATGGQVNVPTGLESVGWTSEDGLTFAKDTNTSDVRGWGSGSFLRRDIQSQDLSIQFTALETKKQTQELKLGRALTTAELTLSADGEVKQDILDRPGLRYWRVVAIAVDGDGADRIFLAKIYHKAVVSAMDDENWTDGDNPIQYNVTMSALPDDEEGTVGCELLFGPGFVSRATEMGFTPATP
jgi:hypothetical protein